MEKLEGLLSNPALQMGLGILAANNSDNFAQNLGRGGLLGLRNLQQQQQAQAINKMREAQMKEVERRSQVQRQQAQAGDLFKKKHPELADAYDISPTQALKMAYPQANVGTQPYFQAVPTPQGIGRFNARTGEMEIIKNSQGQPFMKSSDSAALQGDIAGSKAAATGNYKINTDVDGMVTTDTKLANQINRRFPQPQNRAPIPTNGGNPVLNVEPELTQADQVTNQSQANLAELDAAIQSARTPEIRNALMQEKSRLTGGGIKVPTKAEQAAEVEAAKFVAKETADAQVDLPRVIDEAANSIRLVDELIEHEGFEGAVGLSSYNPLNKMAGSPENDFNIRLDQIKGKQFLQAFESLKGGGQITEIEGRMATDAIARMQTSASEGEFKQAAKDFKSVIQAGVDRAKTKAGQPASESQPTQTVGSGKFSVQAPNGKTYSFSTQSELNNFKMKANIR